MSDTKIEWYARYCELPGSTKEEVFADMMQSIRQHLPTRVFYTQELLNAEGVPDSHQNLVKRSIKITIEIIPELDAPAHEHLNG